MSNRLVQGFFKRSIYNMARLAKNQLKNLFEGTVLKDGYVCGDNNPFIISKDEFNAYVFIKNISPAYYHNYPDNSRVQLPTSDRFKEVMNSELDFLILGYDHDNDVFAAWNPSIVKLRLNSKRNVSVYSRFSWQKSVSDGCFIQKHLGNEEKLFLFKREMLSRYFKKYKDLFGLQRDILSVDVKSNENLSIQRDEIRGVNDPSLEKHRVLQSTAVLKEISQAEPQYIDSDLNEILKAYARNGTIDQKEFDYVSNRGCRFVHFNGDGFQDGLRTRNSTFLVHGFERNLLMSVTKELVIEQSDFTETTFLALKTRLWSYFKEFCQIEDSRISINDHFITIHLIIKNYLQTKSAKMATKDEILEAVNSKWFFSNISWDTIDSSKVKHRVCAGKNEAGKSYYYYDGMVTDISDYNYKSVKAYVKHIGEIECNVSLASLAKNLHFMYHDFKVRTLITICHDLYGYNHKYYQFSSSANLQLERLIFSELQAVKNNLNSSIVVPKQFVEKVATSEVLWLMKEIFDHDDSHDELVFSVSECDFQSAIFSSNSNLILAFIFIFIEFFNEYDTIKAVGHNRIYTLVRYKQTITLKNTTSI